MKRVALITELMGPDLSPGDRFLVPTLRNLGIIASPVPWDDASVDWQAFDALVLRACWHYPEEPERFRDWIMEREQNGIPIWNNSRVVLWNMDKRYLRDLEDRHVPVVPTVWVEQGARPDLERILSEMWWKRPVIKPQISSGADNTWRIDWPPSIEDQARVQQMSSDRSLMIQKLIPQISDGEWSLIFIEEIFNHAVIKRPADGKIFVQENKGGSTSTVSAPRALIDEAAHIVHLAKVLTGSSLLYARVDGIQDQGRLTLMELELIEPSLYMRDQPQTVKRFAEAIAGRLV